MTFRRLDWPGAYSGIVSDNVLDPSTGVVISTFKTAPFDDSFNPPNDGGDTYMNVANLERFYFAEGWVKLRWEYWSTSPPTRNLTGECPTLPTWEVVPSFSGAQLTDCRTWTKIIPDAGGWSVSDYGWGWP